MLKLQWRGGFGYGDTLNAITYSYSSTIRYNTPVTTTIYWPFSEDYKHSKLDPETVLERFNYICGTMRQGKHPVIFKHKFLNKKPAFRYANNWDNKNHLHGIWYTDEKQTNKNKIVVWSSETNAEPVEFAKDPCKGKWDNLINWLKQKGYEVVKISYTTPIKETIQHINECCLGIGYDGMIHQFFKYLWKPIIVVCRRFKLNTLLVPQAVLVTDIEKIYNQSISSLIEKCKNNMITIKKEHEKYLYENTFKN